MFRSAWRTAVNSFQLKVHQELKTALKAHWRSLTRLAALSLVIALPYVVEPLTSGRFRAATAYLYLAAAFFLLGIVSRIAFVTTSWILLLAALLMQHIQRHWGFGQIDSRLEAFFESPPSEIFEYLRSHVDALDVGLSTMVVVLCGLAVTFSRMHRIRTPVLRTTGLVALGAWTMTVFLFRFDIPYRNFPPIQLLAESNDARERYNQLSRRAASLARHPISPHSCSLRYNRIVIVLGESAVSDHMSIFGYAKRTTPFAQQSAPYAFDALSPANQTRYALAMMLTDAVPDNFEVFFDAHSLVGVLSSCGMKTLWISNQGRRGQYDSFSTSIAAEADESVFLNEWSWTEASYDGKIVKELRDRGIDHQQRQAIFIHLIGSHVKYSERYPPEFGFTGVSSVVEQYDNSLLYTDLVLSQLFDLLYDESTLFIYVSDHGQMVSNEVFGSGFLPGYREEFRTPLLVWTSDAASMDRVKTELGKARLNLESFDNLVSFLSGITPSPRLSTRDEVAVLSPEYVKLYRNLPSFGDGH